MPGSLQNRVNHLALAFVEGRMHDMVKHYADTVTVYGDDGILRLTGKDEVIAALELHREKVREAGMIGLTGRVVMQSLPRSKRFHFVIRWTYEMGHGVEPRIAEMGYFCRSDDRGCDCIELIEFRKLAFAGAMSWYPSNLLNMRKPPVLASVP